MGQDPNQPYSNPYGQQPPQQPPQPGPGGEYYQGYQQQPQQGGTYPPPNTGYQQPNPGGYPPPNTGYQQPGPGGYQQYGQPGQPGQVYNTAHPNGPTSMNMDPNTAAGLSYLGWWITGLIFYLGEKQNRFVRFHAMQSILTFVAVTILYIVTGIIFSLPFIGLIGCVLWPLLALASVGLWIYMMINAFQGKYVKLPLVGDYAERYANSGTGTPLM